MRWQWGGGDITPDDKIKIVDDAKRIVTILAESNSIDIPQVTTIFDLLDATRIVQDKIEGTQYTDQTLESIAQTLEKINKL